MDLRVEAKPNMRKIADVRSSLLSFAERAAFESRGLVAESLRMVCSLLADIAETFNVLMNQFVPLPLGTKLLHTVFFVLGNYFRHRVNGSAEEGVKQILTRF